MDSTATAAALRDEHPPPSQGDLYRPVRCHACDVIVSLIDSECWSCYSYFGATAFDDQR